MATYDITGVGPVCIWDAAGQLEFHVTHGMFLGNENSMVTVVYDLSKGAQHAKVGEKKKKKVLHPLPYHITWRVKKYRKQCMVE